MHRAGPHLRPAVELVDAIVPGEFDTRSHAVGIMARAIGVGGNLIFRRRIVRHTPSGEAASFGEVFLGPTLDDIEPDGAGDLPVGIDSGKRRHGLVQGILDGRTGRLLRRRLGGSVDAASDGSLRHGRGTDIIDIEGGGKTVPVIGRDGRTNRRYFIHRFRFSQRLTILEGFGIRAAGGGCSDVGVTTEGFPGPQLEAVLSGSGRVLWTLRFATNQAFGGRLTRHSMPRHRCA
jgi:hypothetical protein